MGILLVVGGSFSYALERIQNGNQPKKQTDEQSLLNKEDRQSTSSNRSEQLDNSPVEIEMSENQELLTKN